MGKPIGIGQSHSVVQALANNIDWGSVDPEAAQWIIEHARAAQVTAFINNRAQLIVGEPKTEEQPEYFTPVLDADVPERHRLTLAKYRAPAAQHGVRATDPVCYRVKAGFNLKLHAPKAGPCYEQFRYLQGWNFSDEATSDCLVFWVPRIVKGSTSKTRDQQMQMLADLRAKLDLPAHHMSGFGKVGLVAGLILAHHKATQECIPLNQYWVRTDTCHADGGRLSLGDFVGSGLRCYYWLFGDEAHDLLGAFALGVEALGT